MFDVLFLLSKSDSKYKLRVPPAALIDYKGFRAIAIANMPIQPAAIGPEIGFFSDGKFGP